MCLGLVIGYTNHIFTTSDMPVRMRECSSGPRWYVQASLVVSKRLIDPVDALTTNLLLQKGTCQSLLDGVLPAKRPVGTPSSMGRYEPRTYT